MRNAAGADELVRHVEPRDDIANVNFLVSAIGEIRDIGACEAERIEHEKALRLFVGLLNEPAETRRRIGVERIDVSLDLARQQFLPRRTARARDGAVRRPVVLPIKSEIHERLIARRLAALHEVRTLQADQRRHEFRRAHLFHRASHARGSLGHRGGIKIPLVAVGHVFRGQGRTMRLLEIFEKVRFIRRDDLPLGSAHLARDVVKMLGRRPGGDH